MKVNRHSRRLLRFQAMLFAVLMLAVVGLFAWLSTQYSYEADWTDNNRNTLSAATKQLLAEIDGPIKIDAFVRETPLLRKRIAELIRRYQRYKKDIALNFINPDVEPQQTREQGISTEGEMIVHYQQRRQHLTELTEQGLTNILQQLVRGAGRSVVFLQGHGERNPFGMAGYDMGQWVAEMQAKGMRSQLLNLAGDGAIPADASVLVVASPQADLLPGEVAQIESFVDSGGHLFWMTDPGAKAGLESLAENLGLLILPGMIMDPNVAQVGMTLFGSADPRISLVASYGAHPIVNGFQFNTMFPLAGAWDTLVDSGWQHEAVLQSLPSTWLESSETSGQITFDEDVDVPGPLLIGLALTRADTANAESVPEQRIFVIADNDFLSNAFLGLGGNLQLAMNIINWLSRDDQLLAIPVRTASDTSLQLADGEIALIGIGFLFLLPGGLAAAGFWLWWRRRRA